MKLAYKNIRDESRFIVTNFNCAPSQELLGHKGLYKIIWCTGEKAKILVDGYSLCLEKEQIIFCTPVNILEIPRQRNIIAIVFNREFYCIRDHDKEVSCNGFLFFGSSFPQIITLGEKQKKSFDIMFEMLKEEFETRDHIQGEMLRTILKRILIKSTRLVKDRMPEPNIKNQELDIVRQYHILVEKHFRQKHQVQEYAEMLFKSPKTLSNLFRKTGSKSPLKVINERIILEAKRLLIYSDKTAEEIAYELGYTEPTHFSKFFKNQVGTPPMGFKSKKITS